MKHRVKTMRQTEERVSRCSSEMKRSSREMNNISRYMVDTRESSKGNRHAHIWNKIPANIIFPPLSGLLPFPKAAEATPPPRPCTMSEMTSPVQKITLSVRQCGLVQGRIWVGVGGLTSLRTQPTVRGPKNLDDPTQDDKVGGEEGRRACEWDGQSIYSSDAKTVNLQTYDRASNLHLERPLQMHIPRARVPRAPAEEFEDPGENSGRVNEPGACYCRFADVQDCKTHSQRRTQSL